MTFNIGKTRVILHFQWASDGYWDWTMDNKDRHYDIAALRIVRREGTPPIALGTLGPISLGLVVGARR